MSDIDEQEQFILEWCDKSGGFDALTSDFHDAFHKRFGGKRHECFWGAQTVYKAMKLAKRMHDKGMLRRGRMGLSGGSWQPGLPKWVWSYYRI